MGIDRRYDNDGTYWRIKGKYLNPRPGGSKYEGSYDKVFEGNKLGARADAESMADGTDITSISKTTKAAYDAYRNGRSTGATIGGKLVKLPKRSKKATKRAVRRGTMGPRLPGGRFYSKSGSKRTKSHCSICGGPHKYKHGKG